MSANYKSFDAVWEWAIPSDTGIANCPSCPLRYPIKSRFLYVSLTSRVSHGRKLFISSVVFITGYQLSSVQFNIYHNAKEYSFISFHFHSIFAALSPTF